LSQPLVDYFMLTLAAQALSLPIMIYHFQQLSIAGLAANFFILPPQPLLMILGGLSLLAGLTIESVGQLLAYMTWPFAHFTIQAAEFFGSLPGAVLVTGQVSGAIVVGFYGIVIAAYFHRKQLKDHLIELKRYWQPGLVLSILVAIAVLTWQFGRGSPDGKLHVTILDVSPGSQSGEGILIQTPGGRFVLVNGGPSATKLSDSLGQRLPTFNRHLDYLVVAGVEDNQIQSLPAVLDRYPVSNVLWSGEITGSNSARQLNAALIELSIDTQQSVAHQALDLGEGSRLEVLFTGPRGSTLLLSWKNFRMLLPIGLDTTALDEIGEGRAIGQLSALLLPASGYAPLNHTGWPQTFKPQIVLLSVSPKDNRGLPEQETLAYWREFPLYRTDHNGWIEIETDGEKMWVQVERK
jgi:competence protein ComEC